nr:lysylphosphatidylglycerol synthase domain-containing protein [Demequina sp. TTPB684]
MAWAVTSQWSDVSSAVAQMGWRPLALATLAAVAALGFNTMSWRAVMRSVGLEAAWPETAAVFLVSQAGKYVPGAVWPVLAQAEFARAHGVSRARAMTGSLVAMAVGVVTAGVVGAAGLVWWAPGAVADYWWALVLVAALAALLVPAVLTRALGLALKVLRRDAAPPSIGTKALLASAAWSVGNWVALGVQAWILLDALTADNEALWPLATGAFALAWLVGFLAVFAPAGLVVREGALVVLLGAVATEPEALALALLSRFAMTLADAVGLAGGVLARRWRRAEQDRTAAP